MSVESEDDYSNNANSNDDSIQARNTLIIGDIVDLIFLIMRVIIKHMNKIILIQMILIIWTILSYYQTSFQKMRIKINKISKIFYHNMQYIVWHVTIMSSYSIRHSIRHMTVISAYGNTESNCNGYDLVITYRSYDNRL